VGTVQPNYGLDELFGARESNVEFMPDISDQLTFQLKGADLFGRYFRQEYKLNGGTEAGKYSNGAIAAVENRFGKGRTLLMGSFPGAGYFLHHAPATRDAFAALLQIAGVSPAVKISDTKVQARLHQGTGGSYLWVTNTTRDDRTVSIDLSAAVNNLVSGDDLWGGQRVTLDGQKITVNVPGRDAAVIALR
jgi:beta-galactosidase